MAAAAHGSNGCCDHDAKIFASLTLESASLGRIMEEATREVKAKEQELRRQLLEAQNEAVLAQSWKLRFEQSQRKVQLTEANEAILTAELAEATKVIERRALPPCDSELRASLEAARHRESLAFEEARQLMRYFSMVGSHGVKTKKLQTPP